jgi:putative N-acetylmannosamine-6-phosphate epimerase
VSALFPRRSIIVSCQAGGDNPLHGPEAMALMAQAAAAGGAAGIRANGPRDVAAIRAAVDLPILGINKVGDPSGVFITPDAASALEVVAAGARAVALDGTLRPRPDGRSLREHVAAIRAQVDVELMADVDSIEAGVAAREAGVDLVGTTLSGYTGGPVPDGPDVALVAALVEVLDCAVVAEGRYWTVDDVRAGFEAGARAIVVGTAITNPMAITRRFVAVAR